jgi:uncharacterized phiE125 gp8 family phage protein
MNQFRMVTAPTALPVSVDEVKVDARIDHNDDDTMLESLIRAATTRAEDWSRRSFVSRTYEMALDRWPWDGAIYLPMPPLLSVVSVAYYDTANTCHQVPEADYLVYADLVPGIVAPVYTKTWPPADLRPISPIRVTYLAGYGDAAAVPEIYKTMIRALVVIDYEHREGMTADGRRQLDLIRARLQADWGW